MLTLSHILLNRHQISERVQNLAQEISKNNQDSWPIFIGVLEGARPFMAELLRNVTVRYEVDFIKPKSYTGSSAGEIILERDVSLNLAGRKIIIIEDILDTGNTLQFLYDHFLSCKPTSIEIICLLDKKKNVEIRKNVKYTGFVIPDEFVVGYGLDYNEHYRELEDLYVVSCEST